MMTGMLSRYLALAMGMVWAGGARADLLSTTPVNSWTFLRNDNFAALFNADTNAPALGAADLQSPNTLSTAAIVGTWGGDIALEIGEAARFSGIVLWADSGDGASGLRFGMFNSDGSLLNGSPGYLMFLGFDTDDTFDRITTASTTGIIFSPLGAQNLNATVLDEQGTWQDNVISRFNIEVERTGSDSTEIRFRMTSESGDLVNINAVATHSAVNGGPAARTFNFDTVGMQFGATASNAPDNAVFFDMNIAVVLPGDYNGDGTVSAADYTVWRDTLGSTTNLTADGSGNNVIDTADYNLWRARFGNTSGSGASLSGASVPEPRSALVLVVALAAAIRRRPSSRGNHV